MVKYDELLERAKNGDESAQNEFLNENKGLVHLAVNKFLNRGTDAEELIQIGMIGLYKAMINFNMSLDFKFSTYAVPMIMGEIKRYIRDDGLIKVSRNVKELSVKIKYTRSLLETKLSRTPKISEIASELGVSKEDIIYTLNASEPVSSLDEDLDCKDNNIYLKDKIKDYKTETEEVIINKIVLRELISKLKTREKQVIIFRFFKELTQQQIADIMGISQVQVCRIEKKVLNELRDKLQ
ncbi:MAG: SigB/SigF/SigG family RNA polymerase sigma factor [Ruminococcaceae bacterium]|nr:SigB/SigF/SigG family RNA polymerase sigma factor [Oscillospiraceae bacterium]